LEFLVFVWWKKSSKEHVKSEKKSTACAFVAATPTWLHSHENDVTGHIPHKASANDCVKLWMIMACERIDQVIGFTATWRRSDLMFT
jgi:hypothetical protein